MPSLYLEFKITLLLCHILFILAFADVAFVVRMRMSAVQHLWKASWETLLEDPFSLHFSPSLNGPTALWENLGNTKTKEVNLYKKWESVRKLLTMKVPARTRHLWAKAIHDESTGQCPVSTTKATYRVEGDQLWCDGQKMRPTKHR